MALELCLEADFSTDFGLEAQATLGGQSAQTVWPATMVRMARPFSSQPWKEVLRLREAGGFALILSRF